MNTNIQLVPLLAIRGAADAIDFYVRALGAELLTRYEDGPERRLGHADLRVGDATFAVTEEARAWNSDAPPSLGGSPVVLQLTGVDVAARCRAMCDAGAAVVFPPQELLGERMARVRDPFGHLWLLRERLEELSTDEIQRRRHELFLRHATTPRRAKNDLTLSDGPAVPQEQKPRVHLVLGPVGAGKSTYGLALARTHGAVRLTLDQWMTALFSADRPEHGVTEWYVERALRCVEQIWRTAEALVGAGNDVILEIGLLHRRDREQFYERLDDAGVACTIHVLDASRSVRRERVNARNQSRGATFSMVVPMAIFELASDLWEPLDDDECAGRDVHFIRTD